MARKVEKEMREKAKALKGAAEEAERTWCYAVYLALRGAETRDIWMVKEAIQKAEEVGDLKLASVIATWRGRDLGLKVFEEKPSAKEGPEEQGA